MATSGMHHAKAARSTELAPRLFHVTSTAVAEDVWLDQARRGMRSPGGYLRASEQPADNRTFHCLTAWAGASGRHQLESWHGSRCHRWQCYQEIGLLLKIDKVIDASATKIYVKPLSIDLETRNQSILTHRQLGTRSQKTNETRVWRSCMDDGAPKTIAKCYGFRVTLKYYHIDLNSRGLRDMLAPEKVTADATNTEKASTKPLPAPSAPKTTVAGIDWEALRENRR
ncbi:hypothetical protein GGX14DRAFT_403754 [Mycena pura]|uniref:Uncharacterized protein n=1 Tax=Mycena pura TaxID=153505 RepID=A0AAD6UW24_9AGAR|nr:hypothetical protein GGX14DRAFT_403754 [Mycena pura]